MLYEYIQKASKNARYKVLDNGTWFAEIPGFEGVWANANSLEKCRQELQEVSEEESLSTKEKFTANFELVI